MLERFPMVLHEEHKSLNNRSITKPLMQELLDFLNIDLYVDITVQLNSDDISARGKKNSAQVRHVALTLPQFGKCHRQLPYSEQNELITKKNELISHLETYFPSSKQTCVVNTLISISQTKNTITQLLHQGQLSDVGRSIFRSPLHSSSCLPPADNSTSKFTSKLVPRSQMDDHG